MTIPFTAYVVYVIIHLSMVSLRQKPITLYVAGPILVTAVLSGSGYVIFGLVQALILSEGWALVLMPFIILSVLQAVTLIVFGFFLIRGIYRWSKVAIIINVLVTPMVFLIILSVITSFAATPESADPPGIITITCYALIPVVMGVIAYNDIRYRLPKLNNQ